MWVLAAYSHPMIVLGTNWYNNHTNNLKATIPPIQNGECIFNQNNFSNLKLMKSMIKFCLMVLRMRILLIRF